MLEKLMSPSKKVSELRLELPVKDFIPYACHYNENTILTKNGELLQVLKVVGFSSEAVGAEDLDLRETIRRAVLENIKSDNFAIWLHTVRRRKNLDPGGAFPVGFADDLNKAWKEKNGWHEMFVNEVYLTVIRDGASAGISDAKGILRSLSFSSLRNNHAEQLRHAADELKVVMDGISDVLEPFGAKRLSVIEDNDVAYSEPLRFFAKILNLAEAPVPMPIQDISEYLSTHKIAVGYNTMEVVGSLGRHFGAIFTVKEYHELPAFALDSILQLPQEFIITQTMDFINCKKALKTFNRQKQLLVASKDPYLSEAIGLDEIIDSDNNSSTAFGDSQITIFLISEKLKGLEYDVEQLLDRCNRLGVVIVRRDLRLEECFWSQLPGNFAYISRKTPISTHQVGGLSSLYNFPAGNKSGNYWGPAVTMFRTASGTPYFFSFHVRKNGHTAIIGPYGAGKTVLLNFLVSEARKFNGRLFFFDQLMASKVFVRSIGGYYTTIRPTVAATDHSYNPLLLEDTEVNRDFLVRWLVILAQVHGAMVTEEEKSVIINVVEKLYSMPEEERRLSSIAELFGPIEPGSLGDKMSVWYGGGVYANLFDNDKESIVKLDGALYGFGMSDVVDDEVSLGPILMYLFHIIEMSLDGRPVIIVLDEAWSLVNNPIFAPGLADWLDRLREKNVVVIFATESVPNDNKSEMTNTVTKAIATQIFLPNIEADKYSDAYQNVWGLDYEEFGMLASMRVEERHFMLKQDGNSVIASLDLKGMKELEVLSGDEKTVTIMNKLIEQKGLNPEDWLPVFYEECAK